MDKSDKRSLTPAKPQTISTAAASLAGRGLLDLQKIQEWELVFPEDRVVGWIEFMDKTIPAQGKVRIPKGIQIVFRLEQHESDISFFTGFPDDIDVYKLDFSLCKNITDESFTYILGLSKLQILDLSFCEQITDKSLSYLTSLPQLQILDLCLCKKITDKGLAYL